MRIALFIDPFHLPKSTCYNKFLFVNEMQKFGYDINVYIPDFKGNKRTNTDCYLNKEFALQNNYLIKWGYPNESDYDVLLLLHNWAKAWNAGADIRPQISEPFITNNKSIISLKFDTSFEHRFIHLDVLYGINTNTHIAITSRMILPPSSNTFIFPSLNLSIPKPNALSHNVFYKKYNLNPKLKLIIFFLGRTDKWNDSSKLYTKPIYWFLKRYRKITRILYNNGYQLIFKLHRNDGANIRKLTKLNKINIIYPEDTYESVKYSDYALSYATTMLYELYLYDLPVFDIGNGIYFPGWMNLYKNNQNPESIIKNTPLSKYNNGRDLIFGTYNNFAKFKKKPAEVFYTFLNTKYDITKFKYLKNHPIYGDSYYDNVNTIAKSLAKQLDIIKIKS
jgi:hypothetical protein